MNGNSMVFIAFEERDNLGIGYMFALLSEAGYQVRIIDFRKDKTDILRNFYNGTPYWLVSPLSLRNIYTILGILLST